MMSLNENEFAKKTPWQRVRILVRTPVGVQILAAMAAFVISIVSAEVAIRGFTHGATSVMDENVRKLAGRIGARAQDIAVQIDRLQEIIDNEVTAPQIKAQLREIRDGILKPTIDLKAIGDVYSKFGLDRQGGLQLIGSAHAQASDPHLPPQKLTMDDVRVYGLVTILSCLGFGFFLCIAIILFSNHTRRLTFAIDTVKVLLGFFVGVATSFFGVAGR